MGNTVIVPPTIIAPHQSLTPMFDSVFGR
jgi:hypothetical protein